MITIKNVHTLNGRTNEIRVQSIKNQILDAEGHLIIPGIVDSHISLGSPEAKKWSLTVKSLLEGGITNVVDIPSLGFHYKKKREVEEKKSQMEDALSNSQVPLFYFIYGQGNWAFTEEIGLQKKLIVGVMISFDFLEESKWDRIFQMAGWEDLPIIIDLKTAPKADDSFLEKVIHFVEKQSVRLYVLNVSTENEIKLIEKARSRALLIYAETTMENLFTSSAKEYLWEGLNRGTIETIGSGYKVDEFHENDKKISYKGEIYDFKSPLFILPQLITSYRQGKITLECIVRITRANIYDILNLENKNEDFVIIDLNEERKISVIEKGETNEINLVGWPKHVILKGQLYNF